MKAKQYFEKYGESIWKEAHDSDINADGPIAKMFIEFLSEVKEIIDRRKVKNDNAVMAVISEQNQKWNAVVNMFVKQYGISPIVRDGFAKGIKQQLGI